MYGEATQEATLGVKVALGAGQENHIHPSYARPSINDVNKIETEGM